MVLLKLEITSYHLIVLSILWFKETQYTLLARMCLNVPLSFARGQLLRLLFHHSLQSNGTVGSKSWSASELSLKSAVNSIYIQLWVFFFLQVMACKNFVVHSDQYSMKRLTVAAFNQGATGLHSINDLPPLYRIIWTISGLYTTPFLSSLVGHVTYIFKRRACHLWPQKDTIHSWDKWTLTMLISTDNHPALPFWIARGGK